MLNTAPQPAPIPNPQPEVQNPYAQMEEIDAQIAQLRTIIKRQEGKMTKDQESQMKTLLEKLDATAHQLNLMENGSDTPVIVH
jgi:hypothetical protein